MTHGEFIGLLETCRRKKLINGDWKDTRIKTPWTFDQDLKMIQLSGLLPRSQIAEQVRGVKSKHIVKDRMDTHFNSGTKFLHGMPKAWVVALFGNYFSDREIITTAGPKSQNSATCFRIIPWVDMEKIVLSECNDETVIRCVLAMANFQRFIFQQDDNEILKTLKKVMRLHGKRTST